MKPLFILYCLLLMLQSKAANDTLTRAQVYNFNVGDTFDYRNENFGYDNEDYSHDSTWNYFSYYRVIIVGKFNSQNLDTLFYAREILGHASNFVNTDSIATDTVAIDSNSNYAVFDTTNFCGGNLCSINIDTGYDDRVVDSATFCGDVGCQSGNDIYAVGLGVTISAIGIGDGNGLGISNITTLIYYSQAGQTWGTPATIVMGVSNINQQNPSITLFPTVNNGQFKLSINAPNNPSPQLIIYDLTGREVKRLSVSNGTNNVALDNASAGMYLWGVTSDGAILKSGKLIIQ